MLEELDDTLKQATLRVVEKALSQLNPDEVYGFALYTSGDFQYLTDSLFTESGLNTVTHKYFDKYDWFREQTGTYEEGKRRLRWSPCDSPQHLFAEEEFNRPAELLAALWRPIEDIPDPYTESNPYERLCDSLCRAIEICMLRSLVHLRQSAILTDSTVLCLMMGDQSNEMRLAYAEILNTPATVALFRQQLQEIDEAELDVCRSQIPTDLSLPEIEV